MYKHFVVFICIILLNSCASAPYHGANYSSIKVSEKRVDLGDTQKIKQVLNQQYKDWRYVQHRMGGTSKKGIDCSGLVYRIYRTKFGFDMPRSTEYQSEIGQSIPKSKLRAGDLLFFKTGIFTRHVGMYVDKGNFLHVSKSKGVMMSNLENPYWRSTYWKTRRVQ
jgi:cell wall-associated NlpC family hydrolase